VEPEPEPTELLCLTSLTLVLSTSRRNDRR
jgi:hypothetical protein